MALALFGLIIGIAGCGAFFYYRALNRPFTKKTAGKSATSGKNILSSIASEIAALPQPNPDDPDEDDGLIKEHGYPLRSRFIPSEDGIYHRAEMISDRGWADLVYTIMELAALPAPAVELLSALSDPNIPKSALDQECSRTPELVARALSIANSPYYNIYEEITDLARAVELLGYEEIRQIVSIASIFRFKESSPDHLNTEDLWKHSMATSRIATWFSRKVGGESYCAAKAELRERLAGTSALLHDVGKIVLERWRPEGFRRAIRASGEKNTCLLTEELKEFGITHALAGALLINTMGLPKSLSLIAKGCHIPVVSEDFPEAALVYVAGQVARVMSMGIDGEVRRDDIPTDVRDFLGLEPKSIIELISGDFAKSVCDSLADCRIAIE